MSCREDEYVYDCSSRRSRRCCVDVIIFILSILFAFTLGLIIGRIPIINLILLLALPALITLAIVFGVLLIIRIVERKCNRNKCCCNRDSEEI